MRHATQICIAALVMAVLASTVFAQGVLIVVDHPTPLPRIITRPAPPPPASYKIKELSVHSRIQDQVAQVQVTQSFVNTGSRQMEVCFVFPLPYDGAIDSLTFMVDGREIEGKLLPAKEARSVYEGYVRRNQDPALLEWIGMGMFKTSVFPVPPGAERTVSMRFSQLLRKENRLTDFLFPLATAKYTSAPVETISIQANISSASKIKSVYSPTHNIEVKRTDENHATIKYEGKNVVPENDFRLFYDTSKEKVSASVISYRPDNSEDGYVLVLTSPDIKTKNNEQSQKSVLFVVDRSGSMAGKKIEQAREALKFVLNNLNEGDMFNIIAYDSSVESFQPELQRYDDKTRKSALGFVEGLYAAGSTNIDGALSSALSMVADNSLPTYVIFLTDGRPTAGETNEAKLAAKIRAANDYNARVISFGVGYDVNSRLLDRISHDNAGQSEFVRPDEDIELHVSKLYGRISLPVMTNLQLNFDVEGAKAEDGNTVNRLYPKKVHDLFAGEQLVLVGRYRKSGTAKIVVTGKVGNKTQTYHFPAKLVSHSNDQTHAFVEKLWAIRRVGEIIDEIDLNGSNQELVKELVALATKHGILTPYTSFLADENTKLRELATTGVRRAQIQLGRLEEVDGQSGFAQRYRKKLFKEAAQLDADAFSSADLAETAPAANATPTAPGGKGGGRVAGQGRGATAAGDDRVTLSLKNVEVSGNEALYRRGNIWYAANAKDVDLNDKATQRVVLQRFSDGYFKLVKENSAADNSILAKQKEGEELVIRFRGVVYHIQ
ncbi:MAG: Ca-activated chloride channel family protein [Pirellulaceae bacterium]|jgi:Ca-activated chloride channel family protein